MKLKTKTVLIITFVSISIASVVYILSLSKKTPGTSNISPSKPTLVQNYKGSFSITLSVNKNQFNFPEKLPFLELESSGMPTTKNYANNIAAGLSFPGEPVIIEDPIDGTTYFWKNDKGSLFVYSKSRKIKFSSDILVPGVNKQLSDASISSIAQDFIDSNKLLEENSFQMGSIKFIEKIPNGEGFRETIKEKAILYQLSILPKTLNYEIISPSSVESASYIQMTQDGLVYLFQITVFPILKNGPTEYELKNYDEVKSSLGDAVLIELRGKTALLSDLPSDSIQSIEISKIEIAYLIDSPRSTSFQPVYKLSGEATLKDSNNKYVSTLYLSAISQNQP